MPCRKNLSYRFTGVHDGQNVSIYFTNECSGCRLKSRCTTGKERRVRRTEYEHAVVATRDRLESMADAMTIRRRTVEHPFGTLKAWMGHTHFLTKGLKKVSTEMSLCVLAYNLKRMISMLGVKPLIATIQA